MTLVRSRSADPRQCTDSRPALLLTFRLRLRDRFLQRPLCLRLRDTDTLQQKHTPSAIPRRSFV